MRLLSSIGNVSTLVLLAAGCGRVGFGTADADTSADSSNEPMFDGIRFRMDVDPQQAGGMIIGEPGQYTVSCGNMCPTITAGVLGQAFRFDGTKRVPLGKLIDASRPYTVAFWLHPDAEAAGATIVVPVSQALNLNSTVNELQLILKANNFVSFEGSIANAIVYTSSTVDIRNAWHHIAMVQKDMTRQLFVDGVMVGTKNGRWDTGSEPLALGSDLDSGRVVSTYLGEIDDLRIYHRALTNAEDPP